MKISLRSLVAVATMGLTTAGCVTSHGPVYSDVKGLGDLAVQQGKGLTLIYWRQPMGGVKVYANDEMIAKIGPGKNGFISYQADPGQLRISSGIGSGNIARDTLNQGLLGAAAGQKGDRVTIHVVAGRTYYVRLHRGFWREAMQLMSEEQAVKEIADCHWQNSHE
jgi:hypothetical protein